MLTGTKMKSFLRIVVTAALIAALTVPLAGCGDGKTDTPPPTIESSPESPPPSETSPQTPTETPTEPVVTPKSVTPVTAIYTNTLDTASFYDNNFYYEMNPLYKVWYVTNDSGPIQDLLDKSFAHWASLMNVDYGGMSDVGGDSGAFIDVLTKCIADGADGLLIDPSATDYARAAELLSDAGIPWMSVLSMPRDYAAADAPLLHPYIAVPYQLFGTAIAGKLFAIKDELWPDVPFEKIALLLLGPETSGFISSNIQDITEVWISRTGLAENCFAMAVDSASVETRMNDMLAQAAGFDYLLIYAFTDNLVDAVNNTLDLAGLAPNAAIVSVTSESEASRELMIKQWENSQQNALEAMLYSPVMLRAEASLGALYAFMSGTATPETIWPSWINQNDKGGESGTYATYAVPYFWLEPDNYKHIIKWTDVYSGANMFPDYPVEDITPYDYEQWRGVPEEYALQQSEPDAG